jgi:type IV secretory pathway VirB4 component
VFLGYDSTGGSFCFDQFELYARGRLSNPNMLILGQLGYGKSALTKTFIARHLAFGRQAWIVDPKGEYDVLAGALGLPVIKLRPGGGTYLNPLDAGPASAHQAYRSRNDLVRALAERTLRRPLNQQETSALEETIAVLDQNPVLSDVVELLFDPPDKVTTALRAPKDQIIDEVRDLGLALQRIANGTLSGMFDQPTNIALDWTNGRGLVLDLSAIWSDDEANSLVMACALGWIKTVLSQQGRQRLVVLDEAWALMKDPATASWLQGIAKLARALGVSLILIMHRLSDLEAVGDLGSRQVALAKGLLADTGCRVVLNQASDQIANTKGLLQLSDREAELLPRLEKGQSLWKIGTSSYVLNHIIASYEWAWVNTDQAMVQQGKTQ